MCWESLIYLESVLVKNPTFLVLSKPGDEYDHVLELPGEEYDFIIEQLSKWDQTGEIEVILVSDYISIFKD